MVLPETCRTNEFLLIYFGEAAIRPTQPRWALFQAKQGNISSHMASQAPNAEGDRRRVSPLGCKGVIAGHFSECHFGVSHA